MGELINGKKPEEIKRILEWISSACGYSDCDHCQYNDICYPQNGREDIVACDALALIEHLEAQIPRWISVEERLPTEEDADFSGRVLCVFSGLYGSLKNQQCTCDWDFVKDNPSHFTHWMSLFELPESD